MQNSSSTFDLLSELENIDSPETSINSVDPLIAIENIESSMETPSALNMIQSVF